MSVRYHPLHEGVLLPEPEYLTTLASDVIVWKKRSLLNFQDALFNSLTPFIHLFIHSVHLLVWK